MRCCVICLTRVCGKAKTGGEKVLTCFNCGKAGHKKSECRQPLKPKGGGKGKVKKASNLHNGDVLCAMRFVACFRNQRPRQQRNPPSD